MPAGPSLPARTGGHRHHALTGLRLVIAVALVLLLPAVLGLAALTYQPPDPPPAQTAPTFANLSNTLDPLTNAQLDHNRQLQRVARTLTAPTLIAAADTPGAVAGSLPSLVLAPRVQPYTLAELRGLVPAAFDDLIDPRSQRGALLLTASLQVPVGAAVVIDEQTPDVRLLSSVAGFVSIISRGSVTVTGSAEHPVHISSWNPARSDADRELIDGRSFILQIGGRMDSDHGIFGFLGFNLGLSSGVAWNSAGYQPQANVDGRVRGQVTASEFRNNYFGAYTREAEGMHWSGNTFADNVAYGFDPHDFSNNFLVEQNIAYGNGKHGFIFSHGCNGNIMRGNISHDNDGHGFMIDDGRSGDAPGESSRVNASSNNQVVDNVSYGNRGSGVEIEGGHDNLVAGNQLTDNYIGVRIKNNASLAVRENIITDNLRYGIDVLDPDGEVAIEANTISGSWGAINLADPASATVSGNTVSDVSAAMVVDGTAIRDTTWVQNVAAFLRWNPMLVLWSLVIAVPLVVVGSRLVGSALRRGSRLRRRNPSRAPAIRIPAA